MYKRAIKLSHHLKKMGTVFALCFISYNGFGQRSNVLQMPSTLNDLRIGAKIDPAIFKHISSSVPLSKQLSIYKIDYIYQGQRISILDSVKVDSLLVGANSDGIIQSIIISYQSNPFVFANLASALGNDYGEFTTSDTSISEKTYCWVIENNYRVSLKPSINANKGTLVMSDGSYYYLFKRTLTNIGSQIDY